MPASASWRTLVVASSLVIGTGCEPSVSARAVWIDVAGADGVQTIHVYDRGQLRELEVRSASASASAPSIRLDDRGRGLLVRWGEQRSVWIDLDDDRRLPLLLPVEDLTGERVAFANDGSALIWTDFDPSAAVGSFSVLPLAPGLPLERSEAAGVQALVRPDEPRWWLSASDAPVALLAEADGATLSLWSWPSGVEDSLVLRRLAETSRSGLPSSTEQARVCASPSACVTRVALDPAGELAIFADDNLIEWQRFDPRAPEDDAPLSFPPALDDLIENSAIGLIHLLDRDHSLWLSSGLLHWWDHRNDELRSLPVLGQGPYALFPIERGRAALFVSTTGPVVRADRDGLRPVSLVTTPCVLASGPVAAPAGGWIAWTCREALIEFGQSEETIVRVSALGLERFTGVPTQLLAIDDQGDLLLYSVRVAVADTLDGIEFENAPRNLYVLSRAGVLTRVDDLDPRPAPVLVSAEFGAYLQAAAL